MKITGQAPMRGRSVGAAAGALGSHANKENIDAGGSSYAPPDTTGDVVSPASLQNLTHQLEESLSREAGLKRAIEQIVADSATYLQEHLEAIETIEG
jgi:hypothetical protein